MWIYTDVYIHFYPLIHHSLVFHIFTTLTSVAINMEGRYFFPEILNSFIYNPLHHCPLFLFLFLFFYLLNFCSFEDHTQDYIMPGTYANMLPLQLSARSFYFTHACSAICVIWYISMGLICISNM